MTPKQQIGYKGRNRPGRKVSLPTPQQYAGSIVRLIQALPVELRESRIRDLPWSRSWIRTAGSLQSLRIGTLDDLKDNALRWVAAEGIGRKKISDLVKELEAMQVVSDGVKQRISNHNGIRRVDDASLLDSTDYSERIRVAISRIASSHRSVSLTTLPWSYDWIVRSKIWKRQHIHTLNDLAERTTAWLMARGVGRFKRHSLTRELERLALLLPSSVTQSAPRELEVSPCNSMPRVEYKRIEFLAGLLSGLNYRKIVVEAEALFRELTKVLPEEVLSTQLEQVYWSKGRSYLAAILDSELAFGKGVKDLGNAGVKIARLAGVGREKLRIFALDIVNYACDRNSDFGMEWRNALSKLSGDYQRELIKRRGLFDDLSAIEMDIIENRITADVRERLEQAGARLGLSRERVRQIQARIIKRLRIHPIVSDLHFFLVDMLRHALPPVYVNVIAKRQDCPVSDLLGKWRLYAQLLPDQQVLHMFPHPRTPSLILLSQFSESQLKELIERALAKLLDWLGSGARILRSEANDEARIACHAVGVQVDCLDAVSEIVVDYFEFKVSGSHPSAGDVVVDIIGEGVHGRLERKKKHIPRSTAKATTAPSIHYVRWMERCRQYAEYIRLSRPDRVRSYTASERHSMSDWATTQREKYQAGALTAEQVDELESIGFEWTFRHRSSNR